MRRGTAALGTVAVLAAACGTAPLPTPSPGARVTALTGGRVLPSPEAAAIPDGMVLIEDATITAIGARGAVHVPPNARVIDCSGGTVTAGFWNSHVQGS